MRGGAVKETVLEGREGRMREQEGTRSQEEEE
jgi:hypothetical protein